MIGLRLSRGLRTQWTSYLADRLNRIKCSCYIVTYASRASRTFRHRRCCGKAAAAILLQSHARHAGRSCSETSTGARSRG